MGAQGWGQEVHPRSSEMFMAFSVRPYQRFPICCPVTYHAGSREGHGMIWNLSVNGWRLSGDVPLQVGQTCPLTVQLPNQERLVVAAAIVRWVRDWDQEYGLETLVVNKQTQRRVEQLVHQLEQVARGACPTLTVLLRRTQCRTGS